MTKRYFKSGVWFACAALAFLCLGSSGAFAQQLAKKGGGAGPADPPPEYRDSSTDVSGPSVVSGQQAGIEVGQYAPDFELQPIEPYAILQQWLGDGAPKSIEQNVQLSQLVGKAPVLLLFGSYT